MSSARGKTAYRRSAKRRVRQGKRWIFPVVLLLCVLIAAFGASAAYFVYSPAGYNDEDVTKYVRSIYGKNWKLQKREENPDGYSTTTGFLYKDEETDSTFSVFSLSVPVEKDSVQTGRSHKALYDNYFSKVIDSHMEELTELAQKTYKNGGPELVIEEAGLPDAAFGAQYAFHVYLESGAQLEETAKLIAAMDRLLAFSCGTGEEPWTSLRAATPSVRVYMKPVRAVTGGVDAVTHAAKPGTDPDASVSSPLLSDWRTAPARAGCRISTISLTDRTSAARLGREEVFKRLENDYVDAAKIRGSDFYVISDELFNKYPAPILTLVNIGGHDMRNDTKYSYRFAYHRKTQTYWLIGMDPCEDFEGNPFGDYPMRGAFAHLVECLGGSFSGGEWTGSWRFGTIYRDASVKTHWTPRSPYTHLSFRLLRDHNLTMLDEVPGELAGTGAVASGRPFSMRDLIKMLDVRITINQKDMTAVMFRDFNE